MNPRAANLFVAIRPRSPLGFIRIYNNPRLRRSARRFLRDLEARLPNADAAPFLPDNGKEFTDRLFGPAQTAAERETRVSTASH